MKELFTVRGNTVYLADEKRMIIGFGNGGYYDIHGRSVPAEAGYVDPYAVYETDDTNDDPWERDWIKNEGIEEKLISESIEEIKWEIDDGFGMFGFKNRAGEFVIEPQYAYAHEFTCGLAAVNLNRTWYRTEEGKRNYENHYGFINERGETVIPFAYDEARPFNKYGVAVVSDLKGSYLIDTEGRIVPGTEGMLFSEFYEYDNRYLEFQYPGDAEDGKNSNGIYDTKEKRILLKSCIESFIEESEDEIKVEKWRRNNECGYPEYSWFYINSRGTVLYPWLLDKCFAFVRKPNASLLSIVGVYEYSVSPVGIALNLDRYRYRRVLRFGVYSANEKMLIPAEYDRIYELTDRLFGCVKNGMATILQVDDQDLCT